MAVDHNLLEEVNVKDSSDAAGSKEKGRKADRERIFRIVCQGSDLITVRKNLYRKYLDSAAGEIAGIKAREKAVKEYRKRFPRIDGMF